MNDSHFDEHDQEDAGDAGLAAVIKAQILDQGGTVTFQDGFDGGWKLDEESEPKPEPEVRKQGGATAFVDGAPRRGGIQVLPQLRYSAPDGVTLEKREEDSGYDLRSTRSMQVGPGETKTVPTGIRFEIPPNYEIQVRSRSGLAGRGIHVLNSPGTVDSGYRGEVGVIIHNTTTQILDITAGDRIAQAILCGVPMHHLSRVGKVSPATERGTRGFGSSGVR